MSVRCIWVISLSKENVGQILVYRQFITVEKRCRIFCKDDYVPLPSPTTFSNNLLVKLGLSTEAKQYVEWRDKADVWMQLPVVKVNVNKQIFWPVVAIHQNPFLVCCLPFVENYQTVNQQNLLSIPSVSVGFTVLLGILNMLESAPASETSLMELENYLSLSMPFGKPSDVESSCIFYIHKFHSQKFLKKQPAWKPFDHKGKQQILFKITEFVRCVQSAQKEGICFLETFGQISVKGDLESPVNDVSVTLTSTDISQHLSLDSVIIHPCVNIPGGHTTMGSGLPKRFRFSPPLHEFVLLQYRSALPEIPPIQGVFKMVGESSVELLIQLALSDKVKNSFDYCVVILVFFNRGPVKSIEFNVNHGSPKLTEDKYTLKWNIGTRFPKNLEAALTAKLEFQDQPVLPNSDPFCIDKNCYVQVNFKQSNYSLSGCNIDPKNVTLSEGNKPKILIDRSSQSTEYRIWNSYGDMPFPINIANKYKQVMM